MYESKHQKLANKKQFFKRFFGNFFVGILVTVLSLFIGMLGYKHYEKMSWLDAYFNSAMILSGMGPVGELKTAEGKIFAANFALFSGIIYLVIAGIIFAPIYHRFVHKFHVEEGK